MSGGLCPVAGCRHSTKPGMLMCLAHWRRVPKPLAHEVWRTWRNYQGAQRAEDGLAHLAAYRRARDAAIAAVDAKVAP